MSALMARFSAQARRKFGASLSFRYCRWSEDFRRPPCHEADTAMHILLYGGFHEATASIVTKTARRATRVRADIDDPALVLGIFLEK